MLHLVATGLLLMSGNSDGDPPAVFPVTVADRVRLATVKVVNVADRTEGSGVVVKKSGPHTYLLTADHLIMKAKMVELRTAPAENAGRSQSYKAEVLSRSAEADLAILRVTTGDDLRSLPIRPKSAKPVLKPVLVASGGWEKGTAPSVLTEIVKGKVMLRRPGATTTVGCWEVERKQNLGRSGGPLVDSSGFLIGVASGHDGDVGYYIHVEEIYAFLNRNGLKWLAEDDG